MIQAKTRRGWRDAIAEAPRRARILVVDDEDDIRRSLQRLVTRFGYTVKSAASAEEVAAGVRGGGLVSAALDSVAQVHRARQPVVTVQVARFGADARTDAAVDAARGMHTHQQPVAVGAGAGRADEQQRAVIELDHRIHLTDACPVELRGRGQA